MAAPDKLLLLFAARGGVDREELEKLLRDEAVRLAAAPGASAAGFLRLASDPFAHGGPPMRGFEATLELRAPDVGELRAGLAGLSERVSDRVHTDLSGALAGRDHAVIPCAPTPLRYQYWMRRRRDLDHAAYLAHYREVHAGFGRRTPGIEGYVQFHVDPAASAAAARAAGLGLWSADSVSELHLASLDTFLRAIAAWEGRNEAMADEENFVDRANSVMFTSEAIAL